MFRGQHAILDITGFVCNYAEGSDIVHNLMKESVKLGTCRVVAEKKVLYDGSLSPPGFSSVLILDESHITCHCYSSEKENGMLGLDAFTCGTSDPSLMIDFIHDELIKLFPNIKTTKRYTLNRFAVSDENNSKSYSERVVFNT